MEIPEEIKAELEALTEGEPIGLIYRDPKDGRHFLKPISLQPAKGKSTGALFLEWISSEGKVRTLEVV